MPIQSESRESASAERDASSLRRPPTEENLSLGGLEPDSRVRASELELPERSLECGIAGQDMVVLAHGPVMLNEALTASEAPAGREFGVAVVDMPWLNRLDRIYSQR